MELISFMTLPLFWIILLLLYLLMSGFYAWQWYWDSGDIQEALFTLLFSLFIPIVGFLVVWIRNYYVEKHQEKQYEDLYSENTFFRDELKILRPIDRESEMNHVAMEEALVINDYHTRRRLVMETLQEEHTMDYLEVLKKALENEDSETSHYASSIIMQLQARAQSSLMEQQKAFEQYPEDTQIQDVYEQELYQLLSGELLEKENLRKYFIQYEKLSDKLLERDVVQENHYLHRIFLCFRQKDLSRAGPLTRRYLQEYPESEDAVLCRILLCIHTRDKETLSAFLSQLSERPVILTQKTLKYIRFFSKEGDQS